jgi:hypothetical protein
MARGRVARAGTEEQIVEAAKFSCRRIEGAEG